MIEQNDSGWFVVNVRDARWRASDAFGRVCSFEPADASFPSTGVHLYLLEPGRPNCRYHRESAQEDFLVLSGTCRLLVNGEERRLGPWDFFHCPAGVTHVLVGAGDGPCAVLAIGDRPPDKALWYPKNELARRYGTEAPEETSERRRAYADVAPRERCDPPDWPPR